MRHFSRHRVNGAWLGSETFKICLNVRELNLDCRITVEHLFELRRFFRIIASFGLSCFLPAVKVRIPDYALLYPYSQVLITLFVSHQLVISMKLVYWVLAWYNFGGKGVLLISAKALQN